MIFDTQEELNRYLLDQKQKASKKMSSNGSNGGGLGQASNHASSFQPTLVEYGRYVPLPTIESQQKSQFRMGWTIYLEETYIESPNKDLCWIYSDDWHILLTSFAHGWHTDLTLDPPLAHSLKERYTSPKLNRLLGCGKHNHNNVSAWRRYDLRWKSKLHIAEWCVASIVRVSISVHPI